MVLGPFGHGAPQESGEIVDFVSEAPGPQPRSPPRSKQKKASLLAPINHKF